MCDERERLIGYVYDDCDAAERRAIEEHLEDCGTCRAEISGLRSVRQDLLAWDVPPHEAIWRPLAPVRVMPWYRQVPAWAMAAAAGVMFLVGAAGGVVTHALVPHTQPATVASASPEQIIPAGVTESRLSEVEQRMVEMMRAELSKRQAVANGPVPARVVPASIGPDLLSARMDEIVGASEQRQWEIVRDVQNEWNRSFRALKQEVNGLKQEVVLMQSGGGR
jgi:Putative zinc-finger